jgi:hypothetical protein
VFSDADKKIRGTPAVAKSKTTKRPTRTKKQTPDTEVEVCRRRSNRRQNQTTKAGPEVKPRQPERRKVQRRRQIDPTTCERDYTQEEIEFMHALDAYKRASGRMFPTCSEILEVVRSLGYAKQVNEPAESSTEEAELVST